MFSRTVDTGKRLFVHQAGHAIFFSDASQGDHHQLLVVRCQVHGFENRRDFILPRRNFVVPRFHGNSELKQLAFRFQHEC